MLSAAAVVLPPQALFVAWAMEASRRATNPTTDEQVDPDDLGRLVREFGEPIYRVALSVVRDPSMAEDVAQDTLVKAWLALPTFRGESSLKSWVLRIAHNTAVSSIRASRSVAMDPFTFPEEATPADRSVEMRVESRRAMDDFTVALGHLDELSRSVVVLREVEGLSYDEIADVLDVPLSTVKTRLMRARRRLGVSLQEWAP